MLEACRVELLSTAIAGFAVNGGTVCHVCPLSAISRPMALTIIRTPMILIAVFTGMAVPRWRGGLGFGS